MAGFVVFVLLWLISAVVQDPADPATPRRNPKDGQMYVWIAPGTFQMGCSTGDAECYEDEKPVHIVRISRGFWLGQTEVTTAAFRHFSQNKGPATAAGQKGDHYTVIG